jgi:hypothetical protein
VWLPVSVTLVIRPSASWTGAQLVPEQVASWPVLLYVNVRAPALVRLSAASFSVSSPSARCHRSPWRVTSTLDDAQHRSSG